MPDNMFENCKLLTVDENDPDDTIATLLDRNFLKDLFAEAIFPAIENFDLEKAKAKARYHLFDDL